MNKRPFKLTMREIEVLKLIARGRTNSEIAKELRISPYTSKAHVSSVLTKLEVTSRLKAAIMAVKIGIV